MPNRLFTDVKEFLSNEINRVFVALVFLIFVVIIASYLQYKANNEILKAIKNCEKKVDFRYFNMTRTLEGIHNVSIDTKTGELKIIHHKATNQSKL